MVQLRHLAMAAGMTADMVENSQKTQGANMDNEKRENDLSSTLISNILTLSGVSLE